MGAGCWHDSGKPGPLSGPSELALSLRIEASKDILPLDGTAQTVVTVTAQDQTGAPVASLSLTVQIVSGGVLVDIGQLSTRSVVTDASGRAVFAYTAPLATTNPAGSADPGSVVQLLVTPSSGDFANNVGRSVQIRLVPPGTVIPPFGVTPGFQFTPGTPTVFDQVRFSAQECAAGDTTSTDCTRNPNGLGLTYSWDFGDSGTATGQQVAHTYNDPGSYLVRLTLTDAFNRFAETTLSVSVGAGTAPTAGFVFSPDDPNVDDPVFFDASTTTPAPGRTIVSYAWQFGDGDTGTGITATHAYRVADEYSVTLTATDDKGQQGAATSNVIVATGLPVAVITYSPETPNAGQTVHFSAEQSTVTNGRTIVGYRWLFGDGDEATLGPNINHVYTLPDDYVVQLFVTDDFGEIGTTTVDITVGSTATAAVAAFTIS